MAAAAGNVKLLEKLLLTLSEFDRCFHHGVDVHITMRGSAQYRHALAAQPELVTILRALRHRHLYTPAADRGYFNGTSKYCRHHRDRHTAMQIRPLTLE